MDTKKLKTNATITIRFYEEILSPNVKPRFVMKIEEQATAIIGLCEEVERLRNSNAELRRSLTEPERLYDYLDMAKSMDHNG